MPTETLFSAAPTDTPSTSLGSYSLTLPMTSLAIGVDNIHHDVFLSPRFLQLTRDYLFDLIRQNASRNYLPGIELRTAKALDGTAFRKLLADVLHSSLTNAKYHKNIEMDLLFRVAILKFLTTELGSQFANLIHEARNGFASAANILNAVSRRTSSRRASLNCNRPVVASSAPSASRWRKAGSTSRKTSSPKRAKPSLAKNSRRSTICSKTASFFWTAERRHLFPRTLRAARQLCARPGPF